MILRPLERGARAAVFVLVVLGCSASDDTALPEPRTAAPPLDGGIHQGASGGTVGALGSAGSAGANAAGGASGTGAEAGSGAAAGAAGSSAGSGNGGTSGAGGGMIDGSAG